MTETKAAPAGLYTALAKLQADMPKVGKGETGEVKGVNKDTGKPYSYTYKYADLADVSQALLPLMGELGLAFTSKPTLNGEGKFVLAYKLVHGPSGETDEGEYLLPSPERVDAQKLGSLITYARRYSLCAVTGLAPGGDDDDGRSAQQVARDAWENAAPARPRQARETPPEASEWESAAPAEESRPAEHSEDADDGDWGDWQDVINDITTPEEAEKADADLREVFRAGAMGPTKARNIRAAIKAKAASLGGGTPSPNGRHQEEVPA